MWRVFSGVVLGCVCLAMSAAGAGYDDFVDGWAALHRNDDDAARAAFTRAIEAGDLSPALLPKARAGRAMAMVGGNQCALALDDANAALKVLPRDSEVLAAHIAANACLGRNDVVLADYGELIAARPTEAENHFVRGRLLWRIGNYVASASDFAQAIALSPKSAYPVVWFAVAQSRAGLLDPAAIKNAMSQVDDDAWPAPILMFYTGRLAADAVDREARRGDAATLSGRLCEADFYIAEWHLGRNDAASAKPMLARAVEGCPHNFIELGEARYELKRLGK